MNGTNISALSEIPAEVLSFRYFGITVAVFTIFAGGIGNTLTILAYATNKKMQSVFNTFVVNLSFVDLITAILMLPFNLAGYVQLQWPFGDNSFTTRIQAFSYFSCGYTSITLLVAITINRFIGIVSPTKYKRLFRRRRLIPILIFCWTFAPACLLPFLVGTHPTCTNVNKALTGFYRKQLLCTFICFPDEEWYVYMQIVRVTFQFIPLGIMLIAYSSMFFLLRIKRKKLLANENFAKARGSVQSSTFITTAPTGIKFENQILHDKEPKKHKTADLLLVVSVVVCCAFVVTFLPSVIINLLPQRSHIDTRWHMAASNLSWFNSGINPIIYAILNPNFRKEYIRLIKAMISKINETLHLESSSSSSSTAHFMPATSRAPIQLIEINNEKRVSVI